jgi:hypothetical protein
VKTPEGSLEIQIPKYSPTAVQAITWIGRDLGPSVLALFKNYETKKDIGSQKYYYVVTAQVSFTELAEIIQKGLSLLRMPTILASFVPTAIGKPVSFTSPPTTGMAEFDEMVRAPLSYDCPQRNAVVIHSMPFSLNTGCAEIPPLLIHDLSRLV